MSVILPLLLIPFWALAIDPFLAWAGPGPGPCQEGKTEGNDNSKWAANGQSINSRQAINRIPPTRNSNSMYIRDTSLYPNFS